MVANISSSTFNGVFNLGNYPTGGYITVKSLVSDIYSVLIYQRTFSATGVYSLKNISSTQIPSFAKMNLTLPTSP